MGVGYALAESGGELGGGRVLKLSEGYCVQSCYDVSYEGSTRG